MGPWEGALLCPEQGVQMGTSRGPVKMKGHGKLEKEPGKTEKLENWKKNLENWKKNLEKLEK